MTRIRPVAPYLSAPLPRPELQTSREQPQPLEAFRPSAELEEPTANDWGGAAGLGQAYGARTPRNPQELADEVVGDIKKIRNLNRKDLAPFTVLNDKNKKRMLVSDGLVALNQKSPEQLKQLIARNGLSCEPGSPAERLLSRLNANKPQGSKAGYAELALLSQRLQGEQRDRILATLNGFLDQKSPTLKPDQQQQIALAGLGDVASPGSIGQIRGLGNCGAVALQRVWADKAPADYLRALTTLANGKVYSFANGNQLRLTPDQLKLSLASIDPQNAGDVLDTNIPSLKESSGARAMSSALMTDALALRVLESNPDRQLTGALSNTLEPFLTALEPDNQKRQMFNSFQPTRGRNLPLLPTEIQAGLEDIFNRPFKRISGADVTGPLRKASDRELPVLALGAGDGGLHWLVAEPSPADKVRLQGGENASGYQYDVDPQVAASFLTDALVPDENTTGSW